MVGGGWWVVGSGWRSCRLGLWGGASSSKRANISIITFARVSISRALSVRVSVTLLIPTHVVDSVNSPPAAPRAGAPRPAAPAAPASPSSSPRSDRAAPSPPAWLCVASARFEGGEMSERLDEWTHSLVCVASESVFEDGASFDRARARARFRITTRKAGGVAVLPREGLKSGRYTSTGTRSACRGHSRLGLGRHSMSLDHDRALGFNTDQLAAAYESWLYTAARM